MNVTKIRRNIMGTISFTAKFKGMRKEQEFIVYPNPDDKITVQSESRFGYVDAKSGQIIFATNCSCGALFAARPKKTDIIENIEELKTAIRKTAGDAVGNNGIVHCDNSKAGNV